MWKTAWDITSANSGAKRLKNIPDVTSWAEGQIRQVLSSRPPAPSSRSALAERGGSAPLSAAQRRGVCGGVAPPPPPCGRAHFFAVFAPGPLLCALGKDVLHASTPPGDTRPRC